jgi:hypothetical protein
MINYLGGLKREFHHIAKSNTDPVEYEPAMVILNESRARRSFHVPQQAMWKYLDPKDNTEAAAIDEDDFEELLKATFSKGEMIKYRRRLNPDDPSLRQDVMEFAITMQAVRFAIQVKRGDERILLCTYFNLAICLQLMEITLCGEAAAQLLMFIQDGLDELKNMEPYFEEPGEVVGEVTMYDGSTKIGHKEVRVTDSQLLTDDSPVSGNA